MISKRWNVAAVGAGLSLAAVFYLALSAWGQAPVADGARVARRGYGGWLQEVRSSSIPHPVVEEVRCARLLKSPAATRRAGNEWRVARRGYGGWILETADADTPPAGPPKDTKSGDKAPPRRAQSPKTLELNPQPPAGKPSTEKPADTKSSDMKFMAPAGPRIGLGDAIRAAVAGNKDVIVLGYAPAANDARIDAESAVFDPVYGVAAGGGRSDVLVRNAVQSFNAFAPNLRTDSVRPIDQVNSLYVRRLFATGGSIELGYSTDYERYLPEGFGTLVNPGWESALNFSLRQPLLRGRGPDATLAPLRIAQANHLQSQYLFLTGLNRALLATELAYWQFAGASRNLQVHDEIVAQAERTVEYVRARISEGVGAKVDELQATEQLILFRAKRIDALRFKKNAANELLRTMGSPNIPGESPDADIVQPHPDELTWDQAHALAMLRPELLAQQAAITAADVEVDRARNGLLPNINARFNYSTVGLDQGLAKSVETVGSFDYYRWNVGLAYEKRYGNCLEHAVLRRAKVLRSQEAARYEAIRHDITHTLQQSHDALMAAEQVLEAHRLRIETAKTRLEKNETLYQRGGITLFERLESERRLADARIDQIAAWIAYGQAVARWRFESGNVARSHGIEVAHCGGSL